MKIVIKQFLRPGDTDPLTNVLWLYPDKNLHRFRSCFLKGCVPDDTLKFGAWHNNAYPGKGYDKIGTHTYLIKEES